MAEKKKQHYVPQFYLKKFVCKSNSPKIEPYLWIHENDVKKKKAPVNAAHKSYFYTVDTEGIDKNYVEDLLGVIEGETKPILDRILSLGINAITNPERYIFAKFLSFMLSRTPKMRELDESILSCSIKSHIFNNMKREDIPSRFKNMSEDSVIELLNEDLNIPKEALIGMALNFSVDCIPEFNARNWCLLHTNGICFITSDHPVVLLNQHVDSDKYLPGLRMKTTDFIFPLSPKVCLYGSYSNVENQALADDRVKKFNSLIYNQSKEVVFSHNEYPDM